MDLSVYYQEFESSYNLSVFVVCLTILAVLFVGIRSALDKREPIWQKVIVWIVLIVILSVVIVGFFTGPYLGKKDVQQQSIRCYEGDFEIVATLNGLNSSKAVFLINGKEIPLKYSENKTYDSTLISPGAYKGKLVYAQHAAQVLYIELY